MGDLMGIQAAPENFYEFLTMTSTFFFIVLSSGASLVGSSRASRAVFSSLRRSRPKRKRGSHRVEVLGSTAAAVAGNLFLGIPGPWNGDASYAVLAGSLSVSGLTLGALFSQPWRRWLPSECRDTAVAISDALSAIEEASQIPGVVSPEDVRMASELRDLSLKQIHMMDFASLVSRVGSNLARAWKEGHEESSPAFSRLHGAVDGVSLVSPSDNAIFTVVFDEGTKQIPLVEVVEVDELEPISDEDVDLVAEARQIHSETLLRYSAYETDLGLQIDFPQVIDPRQALVSAYLKDMERSEAAIARAERRPDDAALAISAHDAAVDFRSSFSTAEDVARSQGGNSYSASEHNSLRRARASLNLILEGSLPEEVAAAQLRRVVNELEKVFPVQKKAIEKVISDRALPKSLLHSITSKKVDA